MDFRTIIRERRLGQDHSEQSLTYLAEQAALLESDARRQIKDYQLTAWLMAAIFNPLSLDNTAQLTMAMANSGERLDLSSIPKPWVDKHSTGGVGDKTTLILLPMLASLDVTMVKMSGRGLGITGGTIDKLEAIPGFRTDLTPQEMMEQAQRIGIALSGQTPKLAPADKTLYGLRDATDTVASIPLIASSVLSKKIAAGAEFILIDLKCGNGSFMKDQEQARALAQTMLEVGKRCGISLRIAITDMNQPLGRNIGNALEVKEAIDVLRGKGDPRLKHFCETLCAAVLHQCGKAESKEVASQMAERAVSDGLALEKMRTWVEAQGGSLSIFESDWGAAPFLLPVNYRGPQTRVASIDAAILGQLAVDLGAGRQRAGDPIDPTVGIELHVAVGDAIQDGACLCTLHVKDKVQDTAAEQSLSAFAFHPEGKPSSTPIIEWVA